MNTTDTRTVQIEEGERRTMRVNYDDDKRTPYDAELTIPAELIYAMTDAQQAEDEAIDRLDEWCQQTHGMEFYAWVGKQNGDTWKEHLEYQKKVREEHAKRKPHFGPTITTVVD